MSELLTGPGGTYELPVAQREIMAFKSNGDFYVSKSHAFKPHVLSFFSRLEKMNLNPRMHRVELTQIAEIYNAQGFHETKRKASQTQHEAMKLFQDAVDNTASDIHIRVHKRHKTQILFRIDGDLSAFREEGFEYGVTLCSTIYQSMADVSDSTFEVLSRQDARIGDKDRLPACLDGIRIATTPQVDGFVMVLRLLYDAASGAQDLSSLGYASEQVDWIKFLMRRPTGINVIGGPTGSGKSTSLQRILTSIYSENEGRKHIISVEDPPELEMPNIVQTPVTNATTAEERSIAFQDAIKAAMRIDPDIIMIGEVRDTPSARLSMQAAMTGHQVWTTLHSNSAFANLDRLIDLGVEKNIVYDPGVVTGLVCQRLVQRLCPDCKIPLSSHTEKFLPSDIARVEMVTSLDNVFVRGKGCSCCAKKQGTIGNGVKGRVAVAEVIVTDQQLMTLLRNGDRRAANEYWRNNQGGRSMLEIVIEKVKNGEVDPFGAEAIVGPLNMGIINRDYCIENNEIRKTVG